jgi:hypothetical protein
MRGSTPESATGLSAALVSCAREQAATTLFRSWHAWNRGSWLGSRVGRRGSVPWVRGSKPLGSALAKRRAGAGRAGAARRRPARGTPGGAAAG